MIRMPYRIFGLAAVLLVLACVPRLVFAAPPRCTVDSPTLPFGSYDAVAGAAVTTTATITVSCNRKALPATIALDAGLHSSGSFNPRLMQDSGSDTLSYNLYTTASYVATNIWGDGNAGTLTVAVTTNSAAPTSTATATVNAQIAASQDPNGACPATPCSYNDTVTITITF